MREKLETANSCLDFGENLFMKTESCFISMKMNLLIKLISKIHRVLTVF